MPISQTAFETAAKRIGCSVAAVRAVTAVESGRSGMRPDGHPTLLFEGHKFHSFTRGRYDKTHPTLSYAVWTKQFYGKTWQAEGSRFTQAMALDRVAALMATSFGAFQIMGFNFKACGFTTVDAFYAAMCKSEDDQLAAFVTFILNADLAKHLISKNWDAFALGYNGPSYKVNNYATKLAVAYKAAGGA